MSRLAQQAAARMARRHDAPSSRPCSEGYELVGLAGEYWLRDLVGAPPPENWRPDENGDGGSDVRCLVEGRHGELLTLSIDVKTFRKPAHLLVTEGTVKADLYILCGYIESEERAYPIGWEWGKLVERAPVKRFGYDLRSYYIHATKLRKIHELRPRIKRGEYEVRRLI